MEKRIRKIEKMIESMSQNVSLHVRDVQRKIDAVRADAFAAFYNNELSVHEFDAVLRALAALERELHENFHDFTVNSETVTLPKSEHIYYH